MSALWGHAIGVMITVMMLSFITLWVWLWRARHKPLFKRMAILPMEDPVSPANVTPGNRHGDGEEQA